MRSERRRAVVLRVLKSSAMSFFVERRPWRPLWVGLTAATRALQARGAASLLGHRLTESACYASDAAFTLRKQKDRDRRLAWCVAC